LFVLAGPAAFFGWIVVLTKALPKDNSLRSREAFQGTIAHELVHVFDMMRVVVPGVMDWRTFRRKALCDGCHDDMAASQFCENARFIDDYGGKLEKAQLKHYWPSRAERWFRAMRDAK